MTAFSDGKSSANQRLGFLQYFRPVSVVLSQPHEVRVYIIADNLIIDKNTDTYLIKKYFHGKYMKNLKLKFKRFHSVLEKEERTCLRKNIAFCYPGIESTCINTKQLFLPEHKNKQKIHVNSHSSL